MVIASVLLIAVAGVLLVVGLIRFDGVLLSSAIGISALAAAALLLGTRRWVRATRRTVGRAAPRSIGRAKARPVLDDEPGIEPLDSEQVAAVGALTETVVVVDGRPRYHLADCPHLLGRAGEALPVLEAVELGFTACAGCRPATALLAAVGASPSGSRPGG